MTRYLLLLTLTILSIQTSGQSKVTGRVVDAQTKEPIAGVSVYIKGTSIGTSSNRDGSFFLTFPGNNSYGITFSMIGYKSHVASLNSFDAGYCVIKLQRDIVQVGVIVVMQDDAMRRLLREAYRKIPENYHMIPTRLNGFYREITHFDTGETICFSEAAIQTIKSSYGHVDDDGQVKILKSIVNEFPSQKEVGIRFYGGLFSANNDDFVKKRDGFIDPVSYRDYRYRILEITRYDGRDVYVIGFDTREDELKGFAKGKLYIDKESKAYIAAEYELTPRGVANFNRRYPLDNLKEGTMSVYFASVHDRFYIKYSTQRSLRERAGKKIVVSSEYVTTKVDADSITHMPMSERLDYLDVFSLKAHEYYSEDFWQEYNVLKRDSLLDSQTKMHYDTTHSRNIMAVNTLSSDKTEIKQPEVLPAISMSFRFAFRYFGVSGNDAFYDMTYDNGVNQLNINGACGSFDYIPATSIQTDLHLNHAWSLNMIFTSPVEKQRWAHSTEFGVTYNVLLNRWTRPLIAELSMAYSFHRFAWNFPDYRNVGDIKFSGKTFDAKIVRFGAGYTANGFSPRIGLRYHTGGAVWVYACAGYFLPVYTRHKLFAEERSGFFLLRKQANENLNSGRIVVSYNGVPTTNSRLSMNSWDMSFGIMIKF